MHILGIPAAVMVYFVISWMIKHGEQSAYQKGFEEARRQEEYAKLLRMEARNRL